MSCPQRFGPFELLQLLGGGMGLVYLARRAGRNERFALKILRHEKLADEVARTRFAREAAAATRLRHPSICPLLEAGEVEGVPYLCMPYVEGEALSATLEGARSRRDNGPVRLPGAGESFADRLDRVLDLIGGVADALHFAHEEGFVHRDVKPGNILVRPDGSAVLLDFGLSRDDSSTRLHLTRTGQLVGTPAYAAPEQIEPHRGPIDRRADVYSLGAALYECVTLRCPFEAVSRQRLFQRVLEGGAPDPRVHVGGLPAALAVVLDTALARSREERYPTAAAMAAEISRLRRGEPVRAKPKRWPRRVLQWSRRNRATSAVLASLLLAVSLLTWTTLRTARARARSVEHAADLDLVAGFGALEQAFAEVPLVPPWPAHLPALEGWLREHGRPLLETLVEVRGRRDQEMASSSEDDGLGVSLELLELRLEAFQETVRRVEERVAWAGIVAERSVGAHAAAWREAVQAVRDDPRFEEPLEGPQFGLVPLGADSRSGLQEFHHLASAAPDSKRPRRDRIGQLVLGVEHGIVFVLVPAPEGAFFIGKHEVTRAQWARLASGSRPSRYATGIMRGSELQTDLHPVNRVSWHEAEDCLVSWGLELPSCEQWRWACRAGTTTTWYTGDRPDSLAGHANIGGRPDGWIGTAPVGTLCPNDFGLHDMHGNVAEPVADPAGTYCGGSFRGGAAMSRVEYRVPVDPDQHVDILGVRAARRVHRP